MPQSGCRKRCPPSVLIGLALTGCSEPFLLVHGSLDASAGHTVADAIGNTSAPGADVRSASEESPPQAAFEVQADGPAPLHASFFDGSQGQVNKYTWRFGDGASSNTRNPSHLYENPGRYTVELTVEGPGGRDSATRVVDVAAPSFFDLVGTIYLNVGSNTAETCFRAANHRGYWDLGEYTRCVGNRPHCQHGSLIAALDETAQPAGGHKWHYGCFLPRDGGKRSAQVVAQIYSDSDGSDDRCDALTFWDLGRDSLDGPYASCGADDIPVCQRGSRKVVMGMALTTSGRIAYHTACVLPSSPAATNIVAVIRSVETFDGQETCQSRENKAPTNDTSWDLANYSSCVNGRPECAPPARQLTLRMTREDNRILYQTACIVDEDYPAPTRHVWDWVLQR